MFENSKTNIEENIVPGKREGTSATGLKKTLLTILDDARDGIADAEFGVLGSITSVMDLNILNKLPDGVYEAQTAGVYKNGLTAKEGYYTRFRKTANVWQLESETKIPMQDLSGIEKKVNDNETKVDNFIRDFSVEVDQEFIPNSENATSSKAVNDYLFGVEGSPEETVIKDFKNTTESQYPTGRVTEKGTIEADITRRRTDKMSIPNNSKTLVFKNFSAGFRGAYYDVNNVFIENVITDNNVVKNIPSNAKFLDAGFKSSTSSSDLNIITIEYTIIFQEAKDRRVVTPTELEDRITYKGDAITSKVIDFKQYTDFNSFTSGFVNEGGSIRPDSTNVRKISPLIDVSDFDRINFKVSIVGAYYRITGKNNTLLSFGVTGNNVKIPQNAKNVQFTIKGSNSSVDLQNDTLELMSGGDFDYIVLKSDLQKTLLDSYGYENLQHSSMSSLDNVGINSWNNFSDGNKSLVTVVSEGLKLHDNDSTLNTQAKIRSLRFNPSNDFTVIKKIKFLQLNSSYNMDMLDGILNGYGATNSTGDDNINKSGFSFAYVHPTLNVRPIYSICKSVDFDTSGNLEIWKIIAPSGYLAGFERIWSGKDITMNEDCVIETQFKFNEVTQSNYYITIKVNGKMLVDNVLMGMINNHGGNNSFLFQCKGISTEPAEYIVKDFKVLDKKENNNFFYDLLENV